MRFLAFFCGWIHFFINVIVLWNDFMFINSGDMVEYH